ncbi:MAG: hypothetical protein LBJ00_09225 [Planctomycetaceae bacterium]|nr:hypothetical protein [Planctomycetaceae bacterium]
MKRLFRGEAYRLTGYGIQKLLIDIPKPILAVGFGVCDKFILYYVFYV